MNWSGVMSIGWIRGNYGLEGASDGFILVGVMMNWRGHPFDCRGHGGGASDRAVWWIGGLSI